MKPRKPNKIASIYADSREGLAKWLMSRFRVGGDLEDILQETFLKTWEADQKKAIKSPRSYMFMVARNLVYRNFKHKQKFVAEAVEDLGLETDDLPQDQALFEKRKFEAFEVALSSLPSRCREVFVLRKLYGMSHKEIAAQLGISAKTVENHITTAIKRCGRHLIESGYRDSDSISDQKSGAAFNDNPSGKPK